MSVHQKNQERGAVLLTTLLLMAVMAAIMVAIVDDIRYSTRRTLTVQAAEQAAWYERGAESYARIWLQNIQSDTQENLAHIIRAQEPIVLPVDNGQIGFQIRDGRNCYNVNQLANAKTKGVTREQFALFLRLLEFDSFDAENLAASIQDWVDFDSVPNTGGAEGLSYGNAKPAYHTANVPMVDISELREVQGVDEAVYQRLHPFVCIGSDTQANHINVNTLTAEQAPLLALLFGSVEALSTAQSVILQRPQNGYADIEDVWNLQNVQDLKLKGAGKALADTRTDRVELRLYVQLDGQTRARNIVFNIDDTTGVELVSRRLVD